MQCRLCISPAIGDFSSIASRLKSAGIGPSLPVTLTDKWSIMDGYCNCEMCIFISKTDFIHFWDTGAFAIGRAFA